MATLSLLLGVGSAQAALSGQQVGGTFAQPTYVTSDPGDAGRLFVSERKGTIQLLRGTLKTQFADISPVVGCGASCEGERGLLSLALSPDFSQSGRLFVFYASGIDGALHIAELIATGPNRESASAATLKDLVTIPHPGAANHNGGQLQIGPDGALYVGTGDGGGKDDEFHNAQDPGSLLGKILRLELAPSSSPSVWSLGLRNPYRFSFDRLNGDMTIGDVGQSGREEIDFAPSPFPGTVGGAGANYGWNCLEGLLPGPATDPQCATPPAAGFLDPVFEYGHTPDPDLGGAERCSVIGGYVVRDPDLAALAGSYVYSDYCGGALRALQLPGSSGGAASNDCSLRIEFDNPVSFGEDAARRLYVVEQGGRVYRLIGSPPADCPPPPPVQPQPRYEVKAAPVFVGIRALRKRVDRGRRALLTVWVSPCQGHRGKAVQLLRNGRANGSKFLGRACTASFTPRIRSGTRFTAAIRQIPGFQAGQSRRLVIKLAHRPRRR